MSRPSNTGKLAAWRKRLRRFSRSGMTVARFCDHENVSVFSFYYWRRKLDSPQRDSISPGQATSGGRTIERDPKKARHAAFRQVTVVPAIVPSSAGVAILLPGGTRIEVGAGHLDTVRAVIAEVTATTYLPPGSRATVDGIGNLEIEVTR